MIAEKVLYKNKDNDDPWGQRRGIQKLRRKFYLNSLQTYFNNRIFNKGLDIACGSGLLSGNLSKFVKDFTLSDYSHKTLELSRKNTDNKYHYKLNTLPKVCFEDLFDIVFLIEALYYLHDEEIRFFFENVKKILKNNSYLIITLEEDRLDMDKSEFVIKKVFVRYKPLFSISEIFYYMDRYINKKKGGRVGISKFLIELVSKINKTVYESVSLAKVELKLGELFKVKHPRKLFILQLKND